MFIRGKKWVDREVFSKEIICGYTPIIQNKDGIWIDHNNIEYSMEEINLGVLLELLGYNMLDPYDK